MPERSIGVSWRFLRLVWGNRLQSPMHHLLPLGSAHCHFLTVGLLPIWSVLVLLEKKF
ncbi:hypothetical protein P154DRAFT_35847 [Amniculicola lignicola CBS 123094]|uniref:Uncharacterized protein n=1 Tax=Amniculicola lignicola CBS 123094 TaxID=1392246 RepID=A0A6A5WWX4_9PLEO|nr:hypothetical protein P154DRAFT_35847 [Amniculicola lignicola CBS 123094]